jgi:hypothetical protein
MEDDMPQPPDQSPFASMAAQLYPENATNAEDGNNEDGTEDEEQENLPAINIKNFNKVFDDIGRLQKQDDHGRAEISGKGGRVATNLAIEPGEDGYFGSLCAVRWSNAMTDHGNPLDKAHLENSGALSISDSNRNRYIWKVPEVKKYLDSAMNNGVDVVGDPSSIQGKKGFLVIDHPKVTGKKVKVAISGHVTAWNGHQTADNSENFMKGAKHIYFYEVQGDDAE